MCPRMITIRVQEEWIEIEGICYCDRIEGGHLRIGFMIQISCVL